MPSQIAHILVGEAALALADPAFARTIQGTDRAPWFRLGCQGPDIFYHSQRTRPVALHYGVLAHRRSYGRLVEGMVESWIREDGDPESPWASYLLGFATHGALDRAAHPFIVYFSGWVDAKRPETAQYRGCHAFLERILDILLWERATGSPVSTFDSETLLSPPPPVPSGFPERLSKALRRAFPSETAEDRLIQRRMENALTDTRRFYALTNPALTSAPGERPEAFKYLDDIRGPRVVSVIYPEIFPRSVDWAGESGRPWLHPCQGSPERRDSFFVLCKAAESEAAGVLRILLGCFRTETVSPDLQAAAGNGTLNVGTPDGQPSRPRFRGPLPLPQALAAEFRMRRERAEGLSH